jgi:hypothetical protein
MSWGPSFSERSRLRHRRNVFRVPMRVRDLLDVAG